MRRRSRFRARNEPRTAYRTTARSTRGRGNVVSRPSFEGRKAFGLKKHGTPRRRARVSARRRSTYREACGIGARRGLRPPAACPGRVGASDLRTETRWLVASPSGTGSPPRASSASARETRRGSRGRRAAAARPSPRRRAWHAKTNAAAGSTRPRAANLFLDGEIGRPWLPRGAPPSL